MKIKVIDVSKKIKKNIILDNINLEFNSGKVYGLVGKNGSGKTMLLRALSGSANAPLISLYTTPL